MVITSTDITDDLVQLLKHTFEPLEISVREDEVPRKPESKGRSRANLVLLLLHQRILDPLGLQIVEQVPGLEKRRP